MFRQRRGQNPIFLNLFCTIKMWLTFNLPVGAVLELLIILLDLHQQREFAQVLISIF